MFFDKNFEQILNTMKIKYDRTTRMVNYECFCNIVHLLTKSLNDSNSKLESKCYNGKHMISIIYDVLYGVALKEFNVKEFKKCLIWAFNCYQKLHLLSSNKVMKLEEKENENETYMKNYVLSETLNFEKMLHFLYNLESFTFNYVTNSILNCDNILDHTGLPLIYSKLSVISQYDFFMFCLKNPHIYGKKYAYQLWNCSVDGFTIVNMVYSFMGWPGPVMIVIKHFDKITGEEPIVGMFLNSNFKECYQSYCGDDLSFIFSINNNEVKFYKYYCASKNILFISSKQQKYNKSKFGIGIGDFYDEPRLWLDGSDIFSKSYFSRHDTIFEEGSPFKEDKKFLNVSSNL